MAGRLDAVLDVLERGDVLVGHSGGGLEVTRAADAAPELVSHVVYLAAALPLEDRLMQEALVYRDDGGKEGDYDVTGMLKHLRIGEDGSMAFATRRGCARALLPRLRRSDGALGIRATDARDGRRHRDDTDLRPALLGGRAPTQLHRVSPGPRATAVARRRHRATPRRRATDHRHFAFAVPEPPRRTRATPRPRNDHAAHRPAETHRLGTRAERSTCDGTTVATNRAGEPRRRARRQPRTERGPQRARSGTDYGLARTEGRTPKRIARRFRHVRGGERLGDARWSRRGPWFVGSLCWAHWCSSCPGATGRRSGPTRATPV